MIALAHGTSDGQKTMGVITLVLITAGYQESGTGPQFWVIATAGLAIGLGTYSGGWRIMRTMGKGIVDIKAPQGLAAETTSAAAILASSHMGFGLSTTQVCAGLHRRVRSGPQAGARCAGAPPARWCTAGCSPCRPPAWSAASLPAIALTGTIGVVIVFAALVAGSATIWTISRRAPVSSENVNDSRDVVINPEKSGQPEKSTLSADSDADSRHIDRE